MARFHLYSFSDVLAIFHVRPDATRVAGIRTWNELGRSVKKDEKGIPILAPVISHRQRKQDDSDESANEPRKAFVVGWQVVHVWDYLQTHGRDLPERSKVSGEVGEYLDRLIAFVHRQGIELDYSEGISPALGVSYSGRIALLPGQSKAETFNTLVHEVCHELEHKSERRSMTTQTVRETEAEAVAFVVGQSVGLNMGNAASDYIQIYPGNAELLTESLEIVQCTSAAILAAIRPQDAKETDRFLIAN